MKNYKGIFFDWDGTAVLSRRAPADEAVKAMKPLLSKGVCLVIVSGTTLDNIVGGEIAACFTPEELRNLYLGLGRGAFNYDFPDGNPHVFEDLMPDSDLMERIHRTCFEIHMELKKRYDFDTDIVFSRPNYCKIDLMVNRLRGDSLYMQENELALLKTILQEHRIEGGVAALFRLAREVGNQYNLQVKSTCDAKYLEVGISDKGDNVDTILRKIGEERGITAEDCSFWGDEFVGIEKSIFGSDSCMCTELTKGGDFYDVSSLPGERPEAVTILGGGVDRFLRFLKEQMREG